MCYGHVAGEADLTYDGFYDVGHMTPGKPLMSLSHYCSQPLSTSRPILFVNTGTLSSVYVAANGLVQGVLGQKVGQSESCNVLTDTANFQHKE